MKKTALGIDIGGTNTVFGWVDAQGNILDRGSIPTARYTDLEEYLSALSAAVGAGRGTADVTGAGIGAPNANYFHGTIEHAPNLPWKGIVPLAERFARHFPGIPVTMTNDANAAALGERLYGGARGMDDFLVVTLGTGVGSGFVAGGKLLLGHGGMAGELGHVIVEPHGRMCGCGRRGCLETYASATGIRRTVFALLADCTEESVFRNTLFSDVTSAKISEAAHAGDPLALRAFELTGEQLGRALANAVAVTEPRAIFLFGGLARAVELIFEPTRRYMEECLLRNFRGKVELLPSSLPESDAAILGAAALVWRGRQELPNDPY